MIDHMHFEYKKNHETQNVVVNDRWSLNAVVVILYLKMIMNTPKAIPTVQLTDSGDGFECNSSQRLMRDTENYCTRTG